MAKIHFKRIVVSTVGPLLENYGYTFNDTNQATGGYLFFEKPLPTEEGVKFYIDFQLSQHYSPPHRSFTVNLTKCKGSFHNPDREYKKTKGKRLGGLMWFHYKVQHYPIPDYWWEFENDDELEIQLKDAVEQFIKYGIPWLEESDIISSQ